MSLPTLLKSGSITKASWMSEHELKRLNNIRAIDWIIEYLDQRFWYSPDQKPKIFPKRIGDRVGIFRSGTGTGKSTVFPPAIFNKFFDANKKTVICTQPTVVTTVEIPQQIVLFNKNLKLGKNIGYQTKALVLRPVRGILFSTIGILLQHLKTLTDEEFGKKYSFIILDEIHNRSIETDTTLYYLKQYLKRNFQSPECPYIILTSGTFDPKPLMDYFDCSANSFLDIIGSSFPIQDNFLDYSLTDLLTFIADLIEKIHVENLQDDEFRDIMVFLHSSAAITAMVEKIEELNAKVLSKGIEFAKQHSKSNFSKYVKGGKEQYYYLCPITLMSESISLGSTDYQNLFSPIDKVTIEVNGKSEKPFRRVVFATNAAETGLTIDTLKYCIDSGLVQEMVYNPNYSVSVLITKSVTQANSRQRRGRVGRKAPGVFYGCYSKQVYEQMNTLPLADISKADLSQFILDTIISDTQMELIIESDMGQIDHQKLAKELTKLNDKTLFKYYDKFASHIKALTIKQGFEFDIDIFENPAVEAYVDSLEKLRILGFIDDKMNPTMFAYCSTKFRMLNIENIRMILAAYQYDVPICMIVTVVAFMNARLYKKNKYTPRNPLELDQKTLPHWYASILRDELIEDLLIYEDLVNYVGQGQIIGKGDLYKHDAFSESLAEDSPDEMDLPKKVDQDKNELLDTITSSERRRRKQTGKYATSIIDYADNNGFALEPLLKAVDFRSEIMSDMMSGNFEIGPYVSLTDMLYRDPKTGYEMIAQIKKCIYEGYRRSLFIYDARDKLWHSAARGITISLDKHPLAVNQPKYIIAPNIIFQSSEFKADKISVLDGMVDVDLAFAD